MYVCIPTILVMDQEVDNSPSLEFKMLPRRVATGWYVLFSFYRCYLFLMPVLNRFSNIFQIRKDHQSGDSYSRGEPVKCGDIIRLTHMETNKNLHSHHFQAPISRNLEVSAFGNKGIGDEGDNWELICSGSVWNRDSEVKFRHVATLG